MSSKAQKVNIAKPVLTAGIDKLYDGKFIWELSFDEFVKAVKTTICERYNTGMEWKYHNYKTIRRDYYVTVDEDSLSIPVRKRYGVVEIPKTHKTFIGESSYIVKRKAYLFIIQKAKELGLYDLSNVKFDIIAASI